MATLAEEIDERIANLLAKHGLNLTGHGVTGEEGVRPRTLADGVRITADEREKGGGRPGGVASTDCDNYI